MIRWQLDFCWTRFMFGAWLSDHGLALYVGPFCFIWYDQVIIDSRGQE